MQVSADGTSALVPGRRRCSPVLVVDDEHDLLQAVTTVLEDEGYAVVGVETGSEALAYLEWARPPLVLLDVMMPDLSGLEVLERVRTRHELDEIPIVLMSAAPLFADDLHGHQAFLKKPFQIEALVDLVDHFVEHGADEEGPLSPRALRSHDP